MNTLNINPTEFTTQTINCLSYQPFKLSFDNFFSPSGVDIIKLEIDIFGEKTLVARDFDKNPIGQAFVLSDAIPDIVGTYTSGLNHSSIKIKIWSTGSGIMEYVANFVSSPVSLSQISLKQVSTKLCDDGSLFVHSTIGNTDDNIFYFLEQ